MPREFLFAKNNVAGTLLEAIGETDATCTLAGQGDQFPVAAECPYHVTVSLAGNRNVNEILHVTHRSGETLTITRGAEGTTPRAWPEGSPIELWQTAQQFNDLNRAVKTMEWFLAQCWGGGDGVLRYGAAPDDGLKVVPGGGLTVTVQLGAAFVNALMFRLAAAYTTPLFTAPVAHPRIDLVQAHAATGTITRKQGTEAASPAAPAADTDCLVLARVYCRVGMTVINATDSGTNGYITDQRTFV